MHGEGAVLRHLKSLGFRLQHQQSALHEFDFSVGCLAVDLRDGIRLCKLMELLAGAAAALTPLKIYQGFCACQQGLGHPVQHPARLSVCVPVSQTPCDRVISL